MSTNNTSIIDYNVWFYVIPPIVRFWLYLPVLIPSIFCTLFLLFVLLFDRNLRNALNNHVIIVLLLTGLLSQLTNYPWMLYYEFYDDVWHKSPIFCSIWGFADITFYFLQLILFAWASFERHILIFHDRWLATKRRRFFLHYLPIISLVLYCLIPYGISYFFPPCENTFDYSTGPCISTCTEGFPTIEVFEIVANNILPSFMIIILSLALLFRVVRQKRRIQQAIQWRKHRKMTIQLLSISSLYLVVTCPFALSRFLLICGLQRQIEIGFDDYAVFISYYAVLLFPFVVMFSVPDFWRKVNEIFRRRRHERRITPNNHIQIREIINKKS